MKPITIGVAGGTGSGKTTVALKILERVGFDRIAYVPHDAYYRDASNLPPAERSQLNFDHPDALGVAATLEFGGQKGVDDVQRQALAEAVEWFRAHGYVRRA